MKCSILHIVIAAFHHGLHILLKLNTLYGQKYIERGSFMVWEINMGVYPRLEFDNIMFINCLGCDFYIPVAYLYYALRMHTAHSGLGCI